VQLNSISNKTSKLKRNILRYRERKFMFALKWFVKHTKNRCDSAIFLNYCSVLRNNT